ncbi:MAG: HU family DNA-binding protein [Nitrospinota bacterium]|jgi:integration host factor subunit beta
MTKAELAEEISVKINLSKKDTEQIISIIFESIIDALSKGDKVELRGFGSFRIRHRSSREGRNPKTGLKVKVPSKKVPFFRAGKELKENVNNISGNQLIK